MALRLTPPTKNMFYLSSALAIIAVVLYLLGVFGIVVGGFAAVGQYAFWGAFLAWVAMTAGVCMKGV
jgi:hypothetical protein